MKKTFTMPRIVVEQFVPNEYVAACGDSGTTYLFTCDAGGGVPGNVYVESNNEPGFQEPVYSSYFPWEQISGDTYRSQYYACNKKHEASSNSEFLNGYYIAFGSNEAIPVIIWTEGGKNTHCTTQLDTSKWETAKS